MKCTNMLLRDSRGKGHPFQLNRIRKLCLIIILALCLLGQRLGYCCCIYYPFIYYSSPRRYVLKLRLSELKQLAQGHITCKVLMDSQPWSCSFSPKNPPVVSLHTQNRIKILPSPYRPQSTRSYMARPLSSLTCSVSFQLDMLQPPSHPSSSSESPNSSIP